MFRNDGVRNCLLDSLGAILFPATVIALPYLVRRMPLPHRAPSWEGMLRHSRPIDRARVIARQLWSIIIGEEARGRRLPPFLATATMRKLRRLLLNHLPVSIRDLLAQWIKPKTQILTLPALWFPGLWIQDGGVQRKLLGWRAP